MKKEDLYNKELIEKARNNEAIMGICYAEYIGDHGKEPPEDWKPTDKNILEIAIRAGLNLNEDKQEIIPIPKINIGKTKDKYILVDMNKEEVIVEFHAEDEDAAITHVFNLYNPPPKNYNLYQIEIDTDEKWNFTENAKIIWLPSEITEDGDYTFED